MFGRGCKHNATVWNATLMVAFVDLMEGKRYDGMLQFDDHERAKRFLRDVYDKRLQLYLQHTCGTWKNNCTEQRENCEDSEPYLFKTT